MINKNQYLFLKRLFPWEFNLPISKRLEPIKEYSYNQDNKTWAVVKGSVTRGFYYKPPGNSKYVRVPIGCGPGTLKSCINDGLIVAKSVQTTWLSPSFPAGYPNRWEAAGNTTKAIEQELAIKMVDSTETHMCLLKKGKDEFFEYERQLRQAK